MSASIGDTIEVYWPLDKEYYGAKVAAFNPVDHLYTLNYFDGEVEDINLTKERWRMIEKRKRSKNSVASSPNTKPGQKLPWVVSDKPKNKSNHLATTYTVNNPISGKTVSTVKDLGIQALFLKQKKNLPKIKNPSPNALRSASTSAVESRRDFLNVQRRSSSTHELNRTGHSKPGTAVKKRRRNLRSIGPSKENGLLEPISTVSRPLLLIANCAVSWASIPPLRRRAHSFQIKQCVQYVCNMLTTAATNPLYLKKLGDSEGLAPEKFLDHILDRRSFSPNPERAVLEEISSIFRNSNDSLKFKKNETDIIKAIRISLHALANLDSRAFTTD